MEFDPLSAGLEVFSSAPSGRAGAPTGSPTSASIWQSVRDPLAWRQCGDPDRVQRLACSKAFARWNRWGRLTQPEAVF